MHFYAYKRAFFGVYWSAIVQQKQHGARCSAPGPKHDQELDRPAAWRSGAIQPASSHSSQHGRKVENSLNIERQKNDVLYLSLSFYICLRALRKIVFRGYINSYEPYNNNDHHGYITSPMNGLMTVPQSGYIILF